MHSQEGLVSRWRAAGLVVAFAVLLPAPVLAQSQPIQSAQDAACRGEAKARVFTAPDPQGLGLYAIGRQIYMACMTRPVASVGGKARGGKARGGKALSGKALSGKSRRVKRR